MKTLILKKKGSVTITILPPFPQPYVIEHSYNCKEGGDEMKKPQYKQKDLTFTERLRLSGKKFSPFISTKSKPRPKQISIKKIPEHLVQKLGLKPGMLSPITGMKITN